MREDLCDSFHYQGLERIMEFLGGEKEWQKFIAGLSDPTPEGLAGTTLCCVCGETMRLRT